MKKSLTVSALRRRFDTINKAISAQVSKLYDLAEEFEDPEFEDILSDYASKLDALVNTDDDPDTSASVILDYIDNELTIKEEEEQEED